MDRPIRREMTKADQTVESAADKLEEFVREAQRSGGVKAKGEAPTDGPVRSAPSSGPQPAQPTPKKKSGGLSPWVVIGAALAVGYVLAKVLDWRGHAHPRV
jgi:hypothetical protein